ncbi:hypothetical protein [Kribbella sp. NPDC003557]|uniref:hypothetical protein n=1 Tax=Kribbella sp. NPDC003557 TaxID=3154449 RepID=UPI0033B284E1
MMRAFRTALVLAWLAVVAVTVNAIATQGLSGGSVFFTDFTHPWRAQINGDFSVHLLLVMAWIVYREGLSLRGVLLAVPVGLGSVYTLPYIFVATFRSAPRQQAVAEQTGG